MLSHSAMWGVNIAVYFCSFSKNKKKKGNTLVNKIAVLKCCVIEETL